MSESARPWKRRPRSTWSERQSFQKKLLRWRAMDALDPSLLERAAAFLRQYPLAAPVVLAMVLLILFGAVFLLFVGTICSYLDDTKLPARLGALVRIGKKVGFVFRGTGRDFAIVLFGEGVTSEEKSGDAPKPADTP